MQPSEAKESKQLQQSAPSCVGAAWPTPAFALLVPYPNLMFVAPYTSRTKRRSQTCLNGAMASEHCTSITKKSRSTHQSVKKTSE
eukprot:441964-Amphidinium_carterae.1